MNGILGSKNSLFTFVIIGLICCVGCKEKEAQKISTSPSEVKAPTVTNTNIRFATIHDNYKEKSSYERLKTDKTEITSTIIQMEGPAWENENVAFRNYFDARNGMDIYGKRKKEMVLDAVGIDENYHELQDWGMDVLKVGNSLGAGAIGMIINDSLYRVGIGAKGSFKIIEESPSSSTLEFNFKNWKVQDRTYELTHTINITEGTHYYKATIQVKRLKGDEIMVAGIVDHDVETSLLKMGDYSILTTHGKQDVEGKYLGMAIAAKSALENNEASNYKGAIDKTHLIHLNGNSLEYKFFVGWELQDKEFKSKDYFNNMVKDELSK